MTTHVAAWAFTNADNDVMQFVRKYDHEPTFDEVRHDGYLWLHEDDDEVTEFDREAYDEWHDGLCQVGCVQTVAVT